MSQKIKGFSGKFSQLSPWIALFLSIGSVCGLIIDRTAGRSLSEIEFFKKGLTPDGLHYSVKTLRFLNFHDFEIIEMLRIQYNTTGIMVSDYFLNPAPWEAALVDPRILYSWLSVPFVKMFGLNGMFVVPIISFIILTQLPLWYAKIRFKKDSQSLAFSISVILLISFYIKYNILANTTDGLSTLLIVLLILALHSIQKIEKAKLAILGITIVSIAACLTRQNEIYVIGILILYPLSDGLKSFRKNLKKVIPSIFGVVIWLMYSFNKFDNYKIITSSDGKALNEESFLISIRDLGMNLPQTAIAEMFQLWIRDQGVFLIIVLTTILMICAKNLDFLSLSFFWCLSAGMMLTTVNGALGSGFRYALPAIFIASIVILEANFKRTRKV